MFAASYRMQHHTIRMIKAILNRFHVAYQFHRHFLGVGSSEETLGIKETWFFSGYNPGR